jgi:hypothetical protein
MANSQVPPSQTGVTQVPALREAGRRTFASEVAFERSASFGSPSIKSVAALASAGSTQANATAVSGAVPVYNVSGGDDAKGVVLPVAVAGTELAIYNAGAGALKVYPASGGSINGGAANAALSVTSKTVARLVSLDGTNWAA